MQETQKMQTLSHRQLQNIIYKIIGFKINSSSSILKRINKCLRIYNSCLLAGVQITFYWRKKEFPWTGEMVQLLWILVLSEHWGSVSSVYTVVHIHLQLWLLRIQWSLPEMSDEHMCTDLYAGKQTICVKNKSYRNPWKQKWHNKPEE